MKMTLTMIGMACGILIGNFAGEGGMQVLQMTNAEVMEYYESDECPEVTRTQIHHISDGNEDVDYYYIKVVDK